MVASAIVEELQEELFTQERELVSREKRHCHTGRWAHGF
jgi:hypothetical protein